MQNQLMLTSIPFEVIKTEISEIVKKELQTFLTTLQPTQKTEKELLTRKEAAKLLNISLVTLNEWTKEGLVQGYRIASRVRYKRAELETSLSKIKTTRRAA